MNEMELVDLISKTIFIENEYTIIVEKNKLCILLRIITINVIFCSTIHIDSVYLYRILNFLGVDHFTIYHECHLVNINTRVHKTVIF